MEASFNSSKGTLGVRGGAKVECGARSSGPSASSSSSSSVGKNFLIDEFDCPIGRNPATLIAPNLPPLDVPTPRSERVSSDDGRSEKPKLDELKDETGTGGGGIATVEGVGLNGGLCF